MERNEEVRTAMIRAMAELSLDISLRDLVAAAEKAYDAVFPPPIECLECRGHKWVNVEQEENGCFSGHRCMACEGTGQVAKAPFAVLIGDTNQVGWIGITDGTLRSYKLNPDDVAVFRHPTSEAQPGVGMVKIGDQTLIVMEQGKYPGDRLANPTETPAKYRQLKEVEKELDYQMDLVQAQTRRCLDAETRIAELEAALGNFHDDVKAAKDERLPVMSWDEGGAWEKVARAIERSRTFLPAP